MPGYREHPARLRAAVPGSGRHDQQAVAQRHHEGPLAGDGDYLSSDDVPGARHFGVWPLSMAARTCFGTDAWPSDRPIPQATIEFDVATPDEVAEAADELEAIGYRLVHGAKEEPWGQTVARLQDPAGLLIGIAHTPWQHDGS